MAIDVDGLTYRTLSDELFCNNRKVLEVTVDGSRVYPDEKFGAAVVKWRKSQTRDVVAEYTSGAFNRTHKIGTAKFEYVESFSFDPYDGPYGLYVDPSNDGFSIYFDERGWGDEAFNWRSDYSLRATYDIDWTKVKELSMTSVSKSRLRTLAAEGILVRKDTKLKDWYSDTAHRVAGGAMLFRQTFIRQVYQTSVSRISDLQFIVLLETPNYADGRVRSLQEVTFSYPSINDVVYTSISNKLKDLPTNAGSAGEIGYMNIVADYNPPIWAYDASPDAL